MGAKVILIVEDQLALQKVVCRELKRAGYETIWTDATQDAKEIIERGGIALVVTDVDEVREKRYGPKLRAQGLKFLRELRLNPLFEKQCLPVIGTTCHMPENALSWGPDFLKAGGNALLEWPAVFDELVPLVNYILDSRCTGGIAK
ncbi:MAG: hypothetical protein WC655_24710 [Candidatus Hydrogenedentales bacterium]|jgi:CheY-like chemotaxis protein